MAVLNNTGIRAGASGAGGAAETGVVANSLRFNEGDSPYLNRTPSAVGNRKTWTWSGWVKRSAVGAKQIFFGVQGTSDTTYAENYFGSDDKLYLRYGYSSVAEVRTEQLFRDASSWMNIVIVFDVTESADTDKLKLYINGSQVTDFSTDTRSTFSNQDYGINNAGAHKISGEPNGTGSYLDAYLADVHFLDGIAVSDATSFGEEDATTGQWIPKEYTGSYGTNGFHLAMDPAETGTTYSDGTNNTADSNGVVNSFILDCVPVSQDFSNSGGGYGTDQIFGKGGKIYTWYTDTSSCSEFKIDLADLVPGVTITSLRVNATHIGYDPWQMTVLDSSKSTISGAANGQAVTGSSAEWQTVAVSGSPRYLKLDNIDDGSNRRLMFYGIEINGEVLIDHTAIGYDSSGGENHWHENNLVAATGSTVWSVDLTTTGTPVGTVTNAFDGNLTTQFGTQTSGSTYTNPITFTPTGGLSYTSSVKIYCPSGQMAARINGGSWVSYSTDVELATGSGTITTIEVTERRSNAGFGLYAVEVDGTILTDPQNLDLLADSPSTYDDSGNGVGNYCTLNPLIANSTNTLSDGNLYVDGYTAYSSVFGTMAMPSSGKWYFECNITANAIPGITLASAADPDEYVGEASESYGFDATNGAFYNAGATNSDISASAGDIVSVAYDADGGNLKFYINNVSASSGNAFTSIPSGDYLPAFRNGNSEDITVNFGQRAFAYTPPTGYKALNVFNLPDPTIADPSEYFDVRSGLSAPFTVNDINFEADLIVGKSTSNDEYWIWADAVRGFDKTLKSDTDTSEGSGNAYTSVGSSGYSSHNNWFSTGRTYTTWAWDAGTTTDTNNTAGSITPTGVRANTTAGFSIVSYTGDDGSSATVGHGLNAEIAMFIVKNREVTGDDWIVYHKALGATKRLKLNDYVDADTDSSQFNDTEPTTSVFTVGSYQNINDDYDYIAYCFSEVEGFSKFGSYEGNNSTDGTYIHLGFRPAMILIKNIDTSASWAIYDNKRDTFNGATKVLNPDGSGGGNANDAWVGSYPVDFLSNGFKLRNTTGEVNGNYTYIYCAWASSPFKYSNAI